MFFLIFAGFKSFYCPDVRIFFRVSCI